MNKEDVAKEWGEAIYTSGNAESLIWDYIFEREKHMGDRIQDFFHDPYDNSLELVLVPGLKPYDIPDELTNGLFEFGFILIHFSNFSSSYSRQCPQKK